MAAAGKRKAMGWGIAAILLIAGAGVAFTRPKPPPIPVTQLEARSVVDAKALGASIPAKFSDEVLSLQTAGVPIALDQVAEEEGVSVVRLWSPSGTLLASSDATDTSSPTTGDQAAISAASGAAPGSTSLTDQADVVRVFEPVLAGKSNAVVAEFVRDAREQGLPYTLIAAVLAVLALLGALMAESAREGAGDSAPGGEDVTVTAPTNDEVPRGDGPPPNREIERLAQKLKTSEASRAAMETQMQQLRSQLRMGSQGADQIVADLDNSLASSQSRAHEAGEKLAVAEARAQAAEQRAAAAEDALGRATPSEATARLVTLEEDIASAKATIAELQGSVAEHQARTRDAEARAGEALLRSGAMEASTAEAASKITDAENRELELQTRAATAEARAGAAEAALAEARERIAELGSHAGSPAGATEEVGQLKLELARAQDLAEQAVAKLESSEAKRSAAEARAAEASAKVADAERRAAATPPAVPQRPTPGPAGTGPAPAAGAPLPESDPNARRSLTKRLGRTAPKGGDAPTPQPGAEPKPPAPARVVSEPQPVTPTPPAPPPPAPPAPVAAEALSATDPTAWKALAKSLRREALGDEAPDEPEEDEVEEEPAAPLTEDDRSELRARLAKASAKKRRKIE